MHKAIVLKSEGRRGCGYRHAGGMYLVSDGAGRDCGRLPVALPQRCPCCGGGIRQSRGFRWIEDFDRLIQTEHCVLAGTEHCQGCPLAQRLGKVGLIWIGECFYKTPQDFSREASEMGISRRISTIPKDLVVGKTWIALAHSKTIKNPEPPPTPPAPPAALLTVEQRLAYNEALAEYEAKREEYEEYLPGVFRLFRPQRIEYIVTGKETDEEIDNMVKRGITPVMLHRIGQQSQMFEEDVDDEDVEVKPARRKGAAKKTTRKASYPKRGAKGKKGNRKKR